MSNGVQYSETVNKTKLLIFMLSIDVSTNDDDNSTIMSYKSISRLRLTFDRVVMQYIQMTTCL